MSHFELLAWCECQIAIKMMAGEILPFCYDPCRYKDPRQKEVA